MHGRRADFIRFLSRRLLSAALLVFVVSSLTFLLSAASQGDYFSVLFGFGESSEAMKRQRAARGLDRPVVALYADWLAHAVRLDFGTSLKYERPVGPLVIERTGNTAVQAVAALGIATLLGLPFGMLTGSRQGATASTVRAVSSVLLSVPPLIAAILLMAVAAFTGILPVGGMTSLALEPTGTLERLRDLAWHVPLPALALALPFVAILERVQSQAIAQALAEPSTTAALARGLSYKRVLWRHAWRLSAKPVAAVAGPIAGTLLSGSFAVELVTSWPGLGHLTFEALKHYDIYLAAGCATAAAVCLAAGMLVSDILLAAVDPRIGAATNGGALERAAS